MSSTKLIQEARAYGAFATLMEDAEKTAALFEGAGIVLPDRLARFLGDDAAPPPGRVVIPPPSSPTRPAGVGEDAIWVPVQGMLPNGLVLALLRAATLPMPARLLSEQMMQLGVNVNAGSVLNVGTKLDSLKKITRTDEGWRLKDPSSAPLLDGDFAWGPQSVFARQEIAAHRRCLVLHVLRLHPSGLQQQQLLTAMEGCPWVVVPINKDMVKMDFEALAEAGKIRRVGPTNKWEAIM